MPAEHRTVEGMARSTPRALSSGQPKLPTPLAEKPAIAPGCQAPMTAPEGSWNTPMRPCGPTSIGGATTVPPAAVTASASALASGVPT